MDVNLEKLELVKKIIETNDDSIILAIKRIFETEKKAVWEVLTPEQQDEINTIIQKENRSDVADF